MTDDLRLCVVVTPSPAASASALCAYQSTSPSSPLFPTFLSVLPFLPLSLEHRMTLCSLKRSPLCLLLPLALPSSVTPPLCCSSLPAMFHSASLLMSHLIPPA